MENLTNIFRSPNKIFRSGIVFTLKIIGAVIAFATNVLIARIVSKEDAGNYFSLLSIITLLFSVARYGLGYSTSKIIAEEESKNNLNLLMPTMFESLKMVLFISTFVTFASVPVFLCLTKFGIVRFPIIPLLVMLMTIVPFCVGSIGMEGIRGLRQSMKFGFLDSFVFKISIFLSFLLNYFLFNTNIISLAISYLFAVLLNSFISMLIMGKAFSYGFDKNLSNAGQYKKIKILTFKLGIVSISTIFVQWAPTVIVSSFLSSEIAAEYFTAFRSASILEFISIAVGVVLGPELVRASLIDGSQKLNKIAINAAISVLILCSVIALPMFIFSNEVMSLFGENYDEGGYILKILVVGQVISAPFSLGLQVLIAKNYEDRASLVSIATALFSVSAICFGIFFAGAKGGAIGHSISVITQGMCFSAAALFNRRK